MQIRSCTPVPSAHASCDRAGAIASRAEALPPCSFCWQATSDCVLVTTPIRTEPRETQLLRMRQENGPPHISRNPRPIRHRRNHTGEGLSGLGRTSSCLLIVTPPRHSPLPPFCLLVVAVQTAAAAAAAAAAGDQQYKTSSTSSCIPYAYVVYIRSSRTGFRLPARWPGVPWSAASGIANNRREVSLWGYFA